MKTSALQITLRAMRDQFTSPRVWGGIGIASLILGLSGPFQTFELLPFAPRLAYWAFMSVLTFVTGSFFGTLGTHIVEAWPVPRPLRLLIVGIMAGLPVAFIVTLINTLALNFGFSNSDEVLLLAGYSIGISIAIVALFEIFRKNEETDNALPQNSAILSRLPPEKRGDLISLSVADHYVEVVTGRGSHLVLMRLSDAIKETQGTPGFQTHRSHWVARNAVLNASRQNGKISLDLADGRKIPVSRTFVTALKGAGLLT